MIAVDTNVLIRVLVDDYEAPRQCEQARQIIGAADRVRIHPAVLLETSWLLARTYRLPRAEVASLLGAICEHPKMLIEDVPHWLAAIEIYRDSSIDFADAVILMDARHREIPLHTFDRKLSQQAGAVLIKA